MRSRAGAVPTNTHNSKVANIRSIGAQEPALRRRTELWHRVWGAVGNLPEDGIYKNSHNNHSLITTIM